MSYLAKNNAYGLLASGVSSGAVSLSLQAGQGDRFPVIASPDYTFVTLEDSAGFREVVKVTARAAASDVMTIERAQEGTAARAWNAGDVVELRMVASLVELAMGHPANTLTAHNASAIVVTPVGNIASTNVQAALAELDAEKEPAFAALGFVKGGTGAITRSGAVASLGIEAAEIGVLTTANATTEIGATAGTNILLTTGATTITGFVAAAAAGVWRNLRVSTGGITLTHSSTFVLPGAANIVTAAGDCFEAFYNGSAWIVRNYQKYNGQAITVPVETSTSKTGAYTVVPSDHGKVLKCSGTWTLSLSAAATLADGFVVKIANDGAGVITIDPNLSETIDAATTMTLAAGKSIVLFCDGTKWLTFGRGGVETFNTRSGAVTLTSGDITGAGGALAANAAPMTSVVSISNAVISGDYFVCTATRANGSTFTFRCNYV